ncbi:unnamed protein product [Prorocentrum cordatum]|uniref:VWFA domain-containing protein n=1 Tax=Prorocentrum cordatum TaxID=2364126 RepID=A0ABN9TCB0_9DINO|nr:unnamed protein product [Polarella glacialis]
MLLSYACTKAMLALKSLMCWIGLLQSDRCADTRASGAGNNSGMVLSQIATLGGTPVQYVQQPIGTYCIDGVEITSLAECQAAVTSLGLPFFSSTLHHSNQMPYGCFYTNGATPLVRHNRCGAACDGTLHACSECGPSSTDSSAICKQGMTSQPTPAPPMVLAPTPAPWVAVGTVHLEPHPLGIDCSEDSQVGSMAECQYAASSLTVSYLISMSVDSSEFPHGCHYQPGSSPTAQILYFNTCSDCGPPSDVAHAICRQVPTPQPSLAPWVASAYEYEQLPVGTACPSGPDVASMEECEHAATILNIQYFSSSIIDSNDMPHGCYYTPGATPIMVFNSCASCGSSLATSSAICRSSTAAPTALPTLAPAQQPTSAVTTPTSEPTLAPTMQPSPPTPAPTQAPTPAPTPQPTGAPSPTLPTPSPTFLPPLATSCNGTIPWLQIGFAMDCTGTTNSYLAALKTTVYELAIQFNASVDILQMAFLCYRDHTDVNPPRYEWAAHPEPYAHWFTDPVLLQSAIAPFYSSGGGNYAEDNAGAMGKMLQEKPWDPSAMKILMVISKDRDSMRTPYDTDASQCQLMQDIRAKNISLILGHLDTDTTTSMLYDSTYKPTLPWRGCYADPSDAEQMKEIQFMGLSPENFSALLIDEVRDSSFNALCPSVPTAQPTPAPPTAVPALASPTSAPTLAPWLANSWEYLDHPFGESCYPDSAVKSMAECEHAAASLGLGYIVSSPVDSNGLSYGCHFTPGASPLLVFNDCFDCGTASTNSHAICRHVPTPQPTQAPWETNSYGYEEPRPVGTQCLVGSEILSMAECQYAAHSKGMYFNVSSLIDSSLLPYGCHYIPGASPHLVFNEFSECGLASITTNAQAICEQEVTAHPTQAPWTTHALQYTELSVGANFGSLETGVNPDGGQPGRQILQDPAKIPSG